MTPIAWTACKKENTGRPETARCFPEGKSVMASAYADILKSICGSVGRLDRTRKAHTMRQVLAPPVLPGNGPSARSPYSLIAESAAKCKAEQQNFVRVSTERADDAEPSQDTTYALGLGYMNRNTDAA
jgi:hypothetical protein